ncbi:Putative membrane protein [Croceitalea dokdonensis DOKDO 023]|uniref:Putative membrane protein n=1 Tax=Croceitalea dokdonensis DOKDO 023 TaxID=1300341 RepID=A0A0P7AYR4_9FLAO|nr:carotenoid biosynthesis protein [Croceitalea dokdonensis]KPM31573.1 Putative membrane protein [Croceitalea dokdonensis DOKDO 023]
MPKIQSQYLAIFVIWLFHISGMIGISFGDSEWFIGKSALNLTVSLLIFLLMFPVNSLKKWLLFAVFFFVGMFSEWLGVNYGLLFGDYTYGSNLGPKIDGVPLIIGAFWGILTFITAEVASLLGLKNWPKIFTAALLMVGLDFLMEKNAPVFDFWEFEGPVPIDNYIAWFLIGLFLQIILHYAKAGGNRLMSSHLYLAQLVFFLFFYVTAII